MGQKYLCNTPCRLLLVGLSRLKMGVVSGEWLVMDCANHSPPIFHKFRLTMTTKSLRRTRYAPTGELKKRGTRPLGETGLLRDQQPAEQLLAQVDKLLTETEVLSARFAAISDVAVAVNS